MMDPHGGASSFFCIAAKDDERGEDRSSQTLTAALNCASADRTLAIHREDVVVLRHPRRLAATAS